MTMEDKLKQTETYVHNELSGEASGHDWWHIYRVTKLAKKIANVEGADAFICEMAALLHDIADEKFNESEEAGLKKVEKWLNDIEVEQESTQHILQIIASMSFKGGGQPRMKTLEGMVVQDADRLDALGAIGIARTFAFGGAKGNIIYDPAIKSREGMSKEEYQKRDNTAINHFYEKLLKLKNLMNTAYGKQLAEGRHQQMEQFLEQFYKEWEGER
ncbi:HD domain-containing protein [Alkalihalobacterium elongatum]|uniref:HD domain-containing protein n=1 Tax=Alkalihalobacterium elongatum TaxID=2675466 RepID=UPI001C1F5D1F|nr:HD domain-containing protein [Alkalihalobacterium elongatum]